MKINILLNNNFFNDHCSYAFIYPIIKSLNFIKYIAKQGQEVYMLYIKGENSK